MVGFAGSPTSEEPVNPNIPVIRVATTKVVMKCCQCGRESEFFVPTALIRFLDREAAPTDLPITTKPCRNCRFIISVWFKDLTPFFRAA